MVATVRQRPTRRQREVLGAYIATGSITAAAHELDIAESTAGSICRGCIAGPDAPMWRKRPICWAHHAAGSLSARPGFAPVPPVVGAARERSGWVQARLTLQV